MEANNQAIIVDDGKDAAMLNAEGLPQTVYDGGEQISLERAGIWITGEEVVRLWNRAAMGFEVLAHVKPGELVYQSPFVTGVVTSTALY